MSRKTSFDTDAEQLIDTNNENRRKTTDASSSFNVFSNNAPRYAIFVYIVGIYLTYLCCGYLQEKILGAPWGENQEKFTYVVFLLWFQCFIGSLFGFVACYFNGQLKGKAPIYEFGLCSLSFLSAMFFSNIALRYVSYPLQVLVKSVKPIPVMLFGVVLNKAVYTAKDYFFIGVILTGIFIFMFNRQGKSHGEGDSNHLMLGLLALAGSLFMDGLTGPLEDRLKKKYDVSPFQLMMNMNVWSVGYLSLGFLITNEATEAVSFCNRYPDMWTQLLGFGLLSSVGQLMIFSCIVNYGSLVVTLITTTRKFTSILISTIIFGHVILPMQYLGCLLVLSGLLGNSYYKNSKKKSAMIASEENI